jgi:hypothetical protein
MNIQLRYPLLVFVLSFLALWLSAGIGSFLSRKWRKLEETAHEDLVVILGATLTLLGLIIGFSFSMAVDRYDQRKNYEAVEANVIGTEYIRAGLMPAADGARVRALLSKYLDQRVLFYTSRDMQQLAQINSYTAQLQTELWSTVEASARVQPTPVVALAVSGMNDVLDSQGYTQAAWWNRIPLAAWGLMMAVGIGCNLLMGYGARSFKMRSLIPIVLPLVVATAFFLIADIDSPRRGVIRVTPENMISLQKSLNGH